MNLRTLPFLDFGRLAVLAVLAGLLPGCAARGTDQKLITVAAASSLSGVMEEVASLWNERGGPRVRCTFNATSTLVRQIESGAPYDVLLSANRYWMEYATAQDLVGRGELAPLALNRLVVIAPRSRDVPGPGSFEALLAGGAAFQGASWALGDPKHVPVGIYGKELLEGFGLWDGVRDRVVPAPSARAALRLVERGEVDFGLVYETDRLGSEHVALVCAFPAPRGDAEVFGRALASAGAEAREFTRWLGGAEVAQAFRRHGFGLPEARLQNGEEAGQKTGQETGQEAGGEAR